MHTGQASFARRAKRPKLQVDYIHMSLLLGHLMSLLIDEILMMEGLDRKFKRGLLKAVNKMLWVQNDLFGRHYLACAEGREDGSGGEGGATGSNGAERGCGWAREGCGVDEQVFGGGKEDVVVLETEIGDAHE